ncbi:hypothetical protein LCGC14_1053000 [marine sediment metagenome]|uniref:Uncharacterized protein n=1 Tax=marine sediment metagenome TaxID=412755 RepID=A0A0F9QUE1_9ZZZZ
MQIITGQITQADQPGPPTGSYQIRYQNITITDQQGQQLHGRIGSKQGYVQGAQVTVQVEQKQNQQGPYNYFKKYDPQYVGQQQGQGQPQGQQQQPQQQYQQPQQQYQQPAVASEQEIENRIMRGCTLKAVLSAGQEILPFEFGAFLQAGVRFIETGQWVDPSNKGGQPVADARNAQPPTGVDGQPIQDPIDTQGEWG